MSDFAQDLKPDWSENHSGTNCTNPKHLYSLITLWVIIYLQEFLDRPRAIFGLDMFIIYSSHLAKQKIAISMIILKNKVASLFRRRILFSGIPSDAKGETVGDDFPIFCLFSMEKITGRQIHGIPVETDL